MRWKADDEEEERKARNIYRLAWFLSLVLTVTALLPAEPRLAVVPRQVVVVPVGAEVVGRRIHGLQLVATRGDGGRVHSGAAATKGVEPRDEARVVLEAGGKFERSTLEHKPYSERAVGGQRTVVAGGTMNLPGIVIRAGIHSPNRGFFQTNSSHRSSSICIFSA